jgi:hypothetical protein
VEFPVVQQVRLIDPDVLLIELVGGFRKYFANCSTVLNVVMNRGLVVVAP